MVQLLATISDGLSRATASEIAGSQTEDLALATPTMADEKMNGKHYEDLNEL